MEARHVRELGSQPYRPHPRTTARGGPASLGHLPRHDRSGSPPAESRRRLKRGVRGRDEDATVSVTFDLSAADVRSFLRHRYGRGRYWRGVLLILAVVTLINVAGTYVTRPRNWINLLSALLVPLVSFPILALLLKPLFMWYIGRAVLRQGLAKGSIGAHEVTLGAEDVRDRTRFSEASVRWEAIHRVDRTDEHLYIYVASASALAIPIRAFATPAQANSFFEIARDRWLRATSSTASSQGTDLQHND
jgi:hypothetical protein